MGSEELWTSYSDKLKTYIMKHVHDQYEAEDILQEVGIRLQKNANRMNEITNVKAWLHQVAHHLIVDYYRRVKKYDLIGDMHDVPVPETTEKENYNKETAECLLKLIDYLPAPYKEAIIESDYYGKKQSILAEKWRISHSGSKTRIQRARKKLKTVLFNCCEVKSDNTGNIIELRNKENSRSKFSCIQC